VLLPAFGSGEQEAWKKCAPFLRWLDRIFVGAGILLVVSGVAWFWAVAAGMSDTSLAEALNQETLATVLFQTQFGSVTQWRLGLAAIFGIVMCWLWWRPGQRPDRPSPLEIVTGVLAIALLVSISGLGHAAAGTGSAFPWRIGADALHLFAASIWPTGLLPFALFLRASRQIEASSILAVVRRFSTISFITVGVLIATGMVNATFLVGSFSALVRTDYGHILCLKLALLLLMLGIAAWNRYRLLPFLFNRAEAGDGGTVARLLRQLHNFVVAEFVLAIAIILVVSFLGITPPPP
jgi:putative copper export protein